MIKQHMKPFHIQLPLELVSRMRRSKLRRKCATDAECIRRLLDEALTKKGVVSEQASQQEEAGAGRNESAAAEG